MTPMRFLTWLHETNTLTDAFYDVVLENIQGGNEGRPSVDLVLHAVRRGDVHAFFKEEGWGYAWMELCCLLPEPSTRLEVAGAFAARGLGHTLLRALCARPASARSEFGEEAATGAEVTKAELRATTWTGHFMSVWMPTDVSIPHFLDFSPEQRLQFLRLADPEDLRRSLVAWEEEDARLDPEVAAETARCGTLEALRFRRAELVGAVRAALGA